MNSLVEENLKFKKLLVEPMLNVVTLREALGKMYDPPVVARFRFGLTIQPA
ncbi:hypothetical protein MWN34_04280 [Ancylobacter sp. 6x-1]|uniref:Uncharacterized protein n=1 Tax=Ancylobacter crimeensis TaxID=2579147 RepID=A0ABT0D846_9HYPH|nr:hypothetical protein [Ancylobacter crimeensis]MCK0196125.1 hypothetical protein [Ancylobacter crimeensis]